MSLGIALASLRMFESEDYKPVYVCLSVRIYDTSICEFEYCMNMSVLYVTRKISTFGHCVIKRV